MQNESRKLIPSREVKDRLGGVSDMSLWRWAHDTELDFPKPVMVRRRKYWDAAAIDAFIERRATTSLAT